MANAEFHKVSDVDFDTLYKVITDYEEYPDFVDGCKSIRVERLPNGDVKAHYQVSVLSQDVPYTLLLKHSLSKDSKEGRVDWELEDSKVFKKNSGSWQLKAVGKSKTDIVYAVDVEFKIAVPGFVLNRLVKHSLPAMVESFEDRAKA